MAKRYRIIAIVIAAGLGLYIGLREWRSSSLSTNTNAIGSNATARSVDGTPARIAARSSPRAADATFLPGQAGILQAAVPRESVQRILTGIRQALAELPTAEAARRICDFLDSGLDADTGLVFSLGPGGTLASAPTLRIFLLDYLAEIDPMGAATYARQILAGLNSPDEWAIAMRNIARGHSADDASAVLAARLKTMLDYEPWRQNPSVGYLEAFDVAVYLGGRELLPDLTALVREQENPAVAHAAFLALDRLVISDPVTTLTDLASDWTSMQGREQTRANLFARANVSDPEQRRLLESYLLCPELTAAELNTFAGVFPNANYMVSHNLLTPVTTPDHAALRQSDRTALVVVENWLADPRFAHCASQLQMIKNRLEGFVAATQPEPPNNP